MKKAHLRITTEELEKLLFNKQYNIKITDSHTDIDTNEIIFNLEGDDLPKECTNTGNDLVGLRIYKTKFDIRVPELDHRIYFIPENTKEIIFIQK